MKKWISMLVVLSLLISGTAAIAERKEVKSVKPDTAPSADAGIYPAPQASFTVGGVEYTLGELQDEPRNPLENRLDQLPGHAISFNYLGDGATHEDANMALYRGVHLITPDGAGGRVYSNWGNTENPYLLYFGLSEGVGLRDCTLVVNADDGQVQIPLGGGEPSVPPQAESEPESEFLPEKRSLQEPEPETPPAQDELPETVFTINYQGDEVQGQLGYVRFDDERNLMGVSFFSLGLSEHIVFSDDGGDITITVPVAAMIVKDGKLLKPVDGTFFRNEAFWFFDIDGDPDIVTFYPHGSDGDPSTFVNVHPKTSVILSRGVEPPLAEPVDDEKPAEEPAEEPEPVSEPEEAPADEPAPEPDSEPEEAPADEPEETPAPKAFRTAMEEQEAKIVALADETDDPWQKAIYASAGLAGWEDDVVTIEMRSFDPMVGKLGKYEQDPDAWLESFFANVADNTFTVALNMDGDVPTAESLAALKKAVVKQAGSAKSEFDKKAVRIALADMILPKPAATLKDALYYDTLADRYKYQLEGVLSDVEDAVGYAPLFWAQSSQTLSVSGGPHALVLNAKGADPAALIKDAYDKTMESMKQRYKASELQHYVIEEAFVSQLQKLADTIRQTGGSVHAFTFDIDELHTNEKAGPEFDEYIAAYHYVDELDRLVEEVGQLPDAPPQPFPKSGRISGSKGGTKVIIKTPDDGDGRYVQMRTIDGDEMKVDAFIRPGSSATVYVPKGMYYLLVASGKDWYGVDGLFGDEGDYSETSETEIKGSNYYHTITLRVEANGNMSSYGASMGDFAQ